MLNHVKSAMLNTPTFKGLRDYNSIDLFSDQSDSLLDKLKETQKFNFANCWYLSSNEIESVAMWNLYSKPNSVALNIKYSDFSEKIKKFGIKSNIKLKKVRIGLIDYINFQNPPEVEKAIENLKFTPFIKDKSFSHENEFRLIAEIEKYEDKPLILKSGISKYKQEKFHRETSQIHGVNVVLNKFFDYNFEIVFHPKIEDWVKKDILQILGKFEIPFKTKNSKLKLK